MSAPPHDQSPRWRVAALLGVLALAVGAFFVLMERVEVTRPRGPIGTARTDPSWAARGLLEARGVRTTVGYGLGALPPTDEIIVVLGNGPEAQRALAPRLEPWVRAGGHLVVFSAATDHGALLSAIADMTPPDEGDEAGLPSVNGDGAEDDAPPAFEARGEAPIEPDEGTLDDEGDLLDAEEEALEGEEGGDAEDDEDDEDQDQDEEATPLPAHLAEPLLSAFAVTVQEALHPAALRDWQVLMPTGEATTVRATELRSLQCGRTHLPWLASAGSTGRVEACRVRYGAGLVTAALDPTPITLPGLKAAPGGAPLLWSYVSTVRQPTAVRFVLQGGEGSVWGLLLERAPAAVLCGLLTALVALWRARAWFGAPAPIAGAPRRGLIEHIDAVGAFLWLRAGGDPLLGPLRGAALRAWEPSQPGVSALPPAEAAAALADRAGLPAAALRAALDDPPQDTAGLVAAVSTLSALRSRARRAG